ncbi:50S ribosomal protein L11 methyltransferase [Oxalobacter vibrioformis]|uniref:Ribosomal protein L11 methyltransferase n=1 Tax=Oxalobacter vibrioformis TaxID=933080 RepID=A0A9E9P4G3_9BURK|nr:50S ribosomal protein L11 methyltransferase [Oxalobacter vibrioformis]WAW11053.1 50S ribosomal protein L11 methyltransferase [Oxalobacter vibrioformis]
MSWNEVVLEVDYTQTVLFSDALLAAGAMAVTVEDANEGTDAERPIFGEPGADSEEHVWQRSRVIALISADIDTNAIISLAAGESGMETPPPFLVREVPQKDWVRETQAQFDPIHIGKNIWVVPSWHETPTSNGIVLELDPGLAFGTGSHPTTRLCLEWLEENVSPGQSVLDYGCGSGILAIAAFKLGAAAVDGVDIDQQAVITAGENAAENQCDIAFYLPGNYPGEAENRQYDIVVANILSGPLQQLAQTIASRLKPGGKLVLSGILDWQEKEVISAYSPWLALSPYHYLDGWVALSGTLAEKEKQA